MPYINDITNLYNMTSNEDAILDYLNECVETGIAPTDILTETITYSEYMPLFETVTELANAKNEIEKLSKEVKSKEDYKKKASLTEKVVDSFKKLMKWWYKEDPTKKFKTLHTIISLSVNIIMLIGYLKIVRTAPINAVNLGNRLPIKSAGLRSAISSTAIFIPIYLISKFLGDLSHNAYMKINSVDLEKNIAAYDKAIDKITDLIEKTDDEKAIKELNKTRRAYSDSLRKLYEIREEIRTKKNK